MIIRGMKKKEAPVPLMQVEEKHNYKTVSARSELELKTQNPGVWGVRRESPTRWVGIIFTD